MNTQIQIRTEDQLSEVKFAGQAEIYNKFAVELAIKQIKKFRDKATGVARILKIQGEYVDLIASEINTISDQLTAAEIGTKAHEEIESILVKRQTRFDMDAKIFSVYDTAKKGTIEDSIHVAIASGDGTVGDVVKYIVDFHKRPRSGLGVDEQYAVHNIKWFVKKGSLRLEELQCISNA